MMQVLSDRLGVGLAPAMIRLEDGTRIELDGADDARTVLVESWAGLSTPEPVHHKKVLTDALMLMGRLVLQSRSWPMSATVVLVSRAVTSL